MSASFLFACPACKKPSCYDFDQFHPGSLYVLKCAQCMDNKPILIAADLAAVPADADESMLDNAMLIFGTKIEDLVRYGISTEDDPPPGPEQPTVPEESASETEN